MDNKYALDANILIGLSRRIYPFDIAPSFWRQLVAKGSKKVVLVDRIYAEIIKSQDDLATWLEKNKSEFDFRSSQNIAVIENYAHIINSICGNPQYKESAKLEFGAVADSWLCAHALTYSYTIVTEEIYEAKIVRKVKVPNVCVEFDIDYINLIQFIRELKIEFT